MKDAYAQSEAHRYVSRQAEREALRVLYVGWTRVCDHLILAAQQGKPLGGLLGTLDSIEPGIIREPAATAGLVETTWAPHAFELRVRTEWPLGLKLETRTLLLGTADLLVESGEVFAIIDHKSFGWTTA